MNIAAPFSKGLLAGLFAVAAGAVVLVGWQFDIPSLKSVLPGFVTMKANTAVGFILAGLSLALLGHAARSGWVRQLSRVCAGATALLGLLTLCQYLFGLDFGIDRWMFREPTGAVGTRSPGRMAPMTAINFLLLGCALFLAGFLRAIPAAQRLVLVTGLMGVLPLAAYFYGATALTGIGHYAQMDVHTAVLFVLLSLGVLLLHPADSLMRTVTSDTAGGWLLWRLAPFVIGVPLVLGWLRVQGEQRNLFSGPLGVALMMAVMVLILTALTAWTARSLNRMDAGRRQADDRAYEREAFSRAALDAVGVNIAVLDRNGVITAVNHAWQEFGRNNGEASGGSATGAGVDYLAVVKAAHGASTEGAAEALAGIQNVLAGRSAEFTIEYPCHSPDEQRWFMLRATPLGGEAGGAVLAHINITERKRAELALRESDERHRVFFEEARDLILVLELPPAGHPIIREANEEAVRVLGYTRDELYGKPISFLEAGASPDALIWERQRSMQKGEAQFFEARHRRKDGSVFDVEVSASEITLSGKRVAVSIERDVTERKRGETALRESEEELRTILKTTMEGFYLADLQGRFLEVNDTYCSMTGYSRDELLRMSIPDVEADEVATEVATQLSRVVQVGKGQFERRHRRKDGTPIDVDISLNFLPIHGGRLVCFLRDITGRKRAEAERAALDEQLRQAQKMESVGQLAGGMAHDFNNILTGIGGYTELALERLDTASPMREDLAEVLRLAKRAAELTRQLLAFSRRQTLEPRVLNINDMIADTIKVLKRVLGEDIDLRFAPAPDLGNVRADPMQMEQVLMSLAINARDAMPAGGKLTIETANVELDAAYAARHISVLPGWYVIMAVSDTGHGMDAATQSHLFEPFFTTKDKGKGTGLGLATAYGIVKQHGGNIWVYSEPGKGAAFKIYLPTVAEAVSVARPTAEPKAVCGDETILIVEDEASVRAVAERALKAKGYAALTASSAEEAERLFAEHPKRVALLLTDVILPGMNGRKLYDRLKVKDSGLKVLYMSGHTDNAIGQQGVLDANVAFMQKPFTIETVARKVRQVLDN